MAEDFITKKAKVVQRVLDLRNAARAFAGAPPGTVAFLGKHTAVETEDAEGNGDEVFNPGEKDHTRAADQNIGESRYDRYDVGPMVLHGKEHEVRVRNGAQAALMRHELQGQMSDGKWENATPHNHWKGAASAKVVVDPENVGTNFHPRRTYDFNNKDLKDIVGNRMLTHAKIGIKYGHEYEGHRKVGMEGEIKDPSVDVSDVKYDHKDLSRDLTDLKAIFKTRSKGPASEETIQEVAISKVRSLFEVAVGQRVRLDYSKFGRTSDPFHGSTGTVIGHEKDGRQLMHRVKLDKPVDYGLDSLVTDDLWTKDFLKKIKG